MSEWVRAAVQGEAREDIGFNFGFFLILMPVTAMFAGAVGVSAQLVTPLEAVICAGLVGLVFVLLVSGNSLGDRVGTVIVGCTAVVVALLASVPALDIVASVLGNTIVLWLPIVVLAIVAWLI